MHVYSHLIPTIERENIDLQDPCIAKWNKELLASMGQIARLLYDRAMLMNSNKNQKIVYDYEVVIGPYSFQTSVPNNEVGSCCFISLAGCRVSVEDPFCQHPM